MYEKQRRAEKMGQKKTFLFEFQFQFISIDIQIIYRYAARFNCANNLKFSVQTCH